MAATIFDAAGNIKKPDKIRFKDAFKVNTKLDFNNKFRTENDCHEYLANMRWPDGFVCPRCGNPKGYYLKARKKYECSECKYQVSATAGTAFHKTKTSLLIWFEAIWLVARDKQSISAAQLQNQFGIRKYKSAWTMLQKIRSMFEERSESLLKDLVEADETYIGGKAEGKRGRGAANKTIVLAAVEVNSKGNPGSIRMNAIEDTKSSTLVCELVNWTDWDATIKTDGHGGYNLLDEFRKHFTVVIGSDKKASEELPWVHTFFSNLKSWLLGRFHGVSKKHLKRYLAEFVYRTNRRFIEKNLFTYVFRRCVTSGRCPYYRELVDEETIYFTSEILN